MSCAKYLEINGSCFWPCQRRNPPITLYQTTARYLLEWSFVGCVVALETRPALAATLWLTVVNTTRLSTGNTHTRRSAAAQVCVYRSRSRHIFFIYLYVYFFRVCAASVCVETTTVKTSPFLFPEFELVTEPEEEEEEDEAELDTTKAEKEGSVQHPSIGDCKLKHSLNIFLYFNVICLPRVWFIFFSRSPGGDGPGGDGDAWHRRQQSIPAV